MHQTYQTSHFPGDFLLSEKFLNPRLCYLSLILFAVVFLLSEKFLNLLEKSLSIFLRSLGDYTPLQPPDMSVKVWIMLPKVTN